MSTMSLNNKLLWIIGLLQAAMLIAVFSPLFAESENYRSARESLKVAVAEGQTSAWESEVLKRDVQVFVCSGLLTALFVNSFVLCGLIDRSVSAANGVEGFAGRRRRWFFLDHPLVMTGMGLGVTLTIAGGIGLGMAYSHPSPLGLWALVTAVFGVVVFIVSLIWGMTSGSEASNL